MKDSCLIKDRFPQWPTNPSGKSLHKLWPQYLSHFVHPANSIYKGITFLILKILTSEMSWRDYQSFKAMQVGCCYYILGTITARKAFEDTLSSLLLPFLDSPDVSMPTSWNMSHISILCKPEILLSFEYTWSWRGWGDETLAAFILAFSVIFHVLYKTKWESSSL